MEITYILGKITEQTLAGDRLANTSESQGKGTLLPISGAKYPHEGRMSHHKLIVLQPYSPKYWQLC